MVGGKIAAQDGRGHNHLARPKPAPDPGRQRTKDDRAEPGRGKHDAGEGGVEMQFVLRVEDEDGVDHGAEEQHRHQRQGVLENRPLLHQVA